MASTTRRLFVSTLILLAAAGLATRGMAQTPVNLVANPGFETGDFTGYTVTRDPSFGSFIEVIPAAAHTGNYGAAFGNRDLYFDMISQALNTAGATLFTVSFYLQDFIEPVDPGGGERLNYSYFNATFGNTTVVNIAPPIGTQSDSPATYTEFTFTDVAGTGDLTILSFSGGDNNNFFYLDDITVTAAPEPSTWAMLLGGAGLLAVAVRTVPRP